MSLNPRIALLILLLTIIASTSTSPLLPKQNSTPLIIIIPGAWTTAPLFTPLLHTLSTTHNITALVSTLPSVNSPHPSNDTVASDTLSIRNNILLPPITAGRDVLLVTHSYGGLPGSAAACGLCKAGRADRGLRGGVVGVVMLASFALEGGVERGLVGSLPGGRWLPWFEGLNKTSQIAVREEDKQPIFFNDVPDSMEAERLAGELGVQSAGTFDSRTGRPVWKEEGLKGRRWYVKTMKDQALPPTAQEGLIKDTGVEWQVMELDSGHCPFATRPVELADLLAGIAGRV